MKEGSMIIRIDYKDLVSLRVSFKAYKDESVADYFKRLAIELKGGRIYENKINNSRS